MSMITKVKSGGVWVDLGGEGGEGGGGGAELTYDSKGIFLGGGVTIGAVDDALIPLNLSTAVDGTDMELDADTFSINFLTTGIYAVRITLAWGVEVGETGRRVGNVTYTPPDPAIDALATMGWAGIQAETWVVDTDQPCLGQVTNVALCEAGSSINVTGVNDDPTESSLVMAGSAVVAIQRLS